MLQTYINSGKEINDKDPKFKIGNHVRISKYKNIFANVNVPSWPEEVFVFKRVKYTMPRTHVISDLKSEERFMKKNCKKQVLKS